VAQQSRSQQNVHWHSSRSVHAHRNIIYELAVTYVYIVALMSCRAYTRRDGCDIEPQSVFPTITISIIPPIQRYTHSFSAHSISSSSTLGTGLDNTSAASHGSLSGVQVDDFFSHSHAPFIPLFLACNLHRDASSPQSRPSSIQMWYTWYYYSLLALFWAQQRLSHFRQFTNPPSPQIVKRERVLSRSYACT
jgi:hypothetical protein